MPGYLHYSFDLWITLIRSNPTFKSARVQYLHENINEAGKSIEEVAKIVRGVDLMCNAINERTGGHITAEEMYLMVISQLHDYKIDLRQIDVSHLYADIEQLLFNYMPVVYSAHTPEILAALKSRPNTTLSILSNTGYIKGSTLREVLKANGLADFFDFQMYSDEESMSKPNKALYDRVIDRVNDLRMQHISLAEIVHVGDNQIADVDGAIASGIKGILINTGTATIQNLINHDHLLRTA